LLRAGKSLPIWASDLQSQIHASGFVDVVKQRVSDWATVWIGYRPKPD